MDYVKGVKPLFNYQQNKRTNEKMTFTVYEIAALADETADVVNDVINYAVEAVRLVNSTDKNDVKDIITDGAKQCIEEAQKE